MNSRFLHEQAAAAAERWSAGGVGREAFLARASRQLYGRPPSPDEVRRVAAYFAAAPGSESAKRSGLLRSMLASNGFLFVD